MSTIGDVTFHRPHDLGEALRVVASGAVPAAGCTDLFPATQRASLSGPVLDLTAVAGLHGITRTPEGWRIGATTSWSAVLHAALPPFNAALIDRLPWEEGRRRTPAGDSVPDALPNMALPASTAAISEALACEASPTNHARWRPSS